MSNVNTGHLVQQRLGIEALEARDMPSGGGFTNGGLDATYYRDTTFTAVGFTRRDPRIDFNWGSTTAPGGSTSPGFRDVATDYYSVRWTGQLIGRFSEVYTFSGQADDAITVELKPAGEATWTTVVDQPALAAAFSGTLPLTAGQRYDVRVSYRESTGAATARLLWASPSTPREVIDVLAETGANNPDSTAAFVDIVQGARNTWAWGPGQDADGWPTADAQYVFQESASQGLSLDPLMAGRLRFSLTGKAAVAAYGNVSPGSLTYAYDPATNSTAGSFLTAARGVNASVIQFTDTSRTGQPGGPGGFTNLKLLRPAAPGSDAAYPAGAVFTDAIKGYLRSYTVVRHQYVSNHQVEWADRTRPAFFNQAGGSRTAATYPLSWDTTSDNGWSWEHKVLLANETGTDLMLSLPVLASGRSPADTQSYVYKLANLLRYGSDGVNPYTAPTADPVYPPLNPNLHVYLELGNELWNYGGAYYADYNNLNKLVERAALANNADFQALNYDHLSTATDASGNYVSMGVWRYRMAVLRMTQVSDIFRGVFGDAAMPGTAADPRVRPVYEWQYDNLSDTARIPLTWADKYFNKADPASPYPGPARPINSYLWGGGGATYYGANNPSGLTALLPNSGFDATPTAVGYTPAPAGAGWTFAGTAGVARHGTAPDDIPAAFDGSQVAYVAGAGRLTAAFTVPASQTSDQYAVSFKALNRRPVGTGPNTQTLRVYLDYGTPQQVDLTARTFNQADGYTPPGAGDIAAWKARNVFWADSDYYYTKAVGLTPGSTHTVTLVGTKTADQVAFVDDVRVTSVDAIFAGGIPGGGEAAGQPAGQNIRRSMATAANWAAAFGLEHVAYEGGWSLGGDDGGSDVQLKAKYGDPRTALAQATFNDYYAQAGGRVNVLGTYSQIPSWWDSFAEQGLVNSGQYPIIQGIVAAADRLPAEPTNGTSLPAVLDRTLITLSDAASPHRGRIDQTAGWMSWTVVAPASGTYRLTLTTGAGGSAVVLVDDVAVASGPTGGAVTTTTFLTKGQHTVKVRSAAGGFAVAGVSVAGEAAPVPPAVAGLSERNGSARLDWAAVPGAAGYVVRYGTTPGQYTGRADVGPATTWATDGLADDTVYYFAVAAYSAARAEGLPSAPRAVAVLTEGATGRLARWQFAGLAADGAAVPAVAAADAASGVTVGPLTRGPGLIPATDYATYYFPDRFSSWTASPSGWGATLPEAIARDQYQQFTLTPAAGRRVTLTGLQFQAWFSNPDANTGVAVRVSTDGVNFTALPLTGTFNTADGLAASLAGLGALQDPAAPVAVRFYLYGGYPFATAGIGMGSASDALVVRGHVQATATAPAVAGVTVNGGDAQRSVVTQLAVTFNTLVTTAADAFVVRSAATGATAPATWTAADVGGRTVVTVAFPAGSIADGRWLLTVNAAAITHRSDGTLTMAADSTTAFHRLFGDGNGDRTVDGADYLEFVNGFGLTAGATGFARAYDATADGLVDGADFLELVNRLGVSV